MIRSQLPCVVVILLAATARGQVSLMPEAPTAPPPAAPALSDPYAPGPAAPVAPGLMAARFEADSRRTYQVQVRQGGSAQACPAIVTQKAPCQLSVSPGPAEVTVVAGSTVMSFSHDYAGSGALHHITFRSKWPLYLGIGVGALGIASFVYGGILTGRCQNGSASERAVACGADTVGYVLGAILVAAAIPLVLWGVLGTGDRVWTEPLTVRF